MADSNLKEPVFVAATGVMASSLPPGFSPAYQKYVLSQASDLVEVAGKANESGHGAYDAQVKNDEQDRTLEDHETRITRTEQDLARLEVRVMSIENDIDGLKIKIQDLNGQISEIKVDYVSLSRNTPQSLSSLLNVTTSYSVNGVKVIGARQTGWTAATGTANKGAFSADQSYTVSSTYTQSEIQALAEGLRQARQRIKALEDVNRNHGLTD